MSSTPQAPAPPNYAPISAAASQAASDYAQTSKDQLAWAQSQYAGNKAFTDSVDTQLANTLTMNNQNAAKDRARYEQLYQPVEDRAVHDAETFDSDANKALYRGRATAAVADQYSAAGDEAKRQLESYGVDPSSTRFGALDIGVRTSRAAAAAGAANQSDLAVENQARAMRSDVINTGKSYPGQIATEQGVGTAAGTGAVGAQNQTYGAAASSLGNPAAWGGLNLGALQGWNSALTGQSQANLGSFNAQVGANNSTSSGIGAGLGLIGGLAAAPMTGGTSLAGSAFSALGKYFAGGGEVGAVPGMGVPRGGARAPMRGVDVGGAAGRVSPTMSPSGGRVTDDVHAHVPGQGAIRVDAGEFILPRRTTQFFGTKYLHGLIKKADEHMAGAVGGTGQHRGALPT